MSIQNKGKPLGETAYGDQGTEYVYVFKRGSYTPFATVTDTGTPTGLLLEKPQRKHAGAAARDAAPPLMRLYRGNIE